MTQIRLNSRTTLLLILALASLSLPAFARSDEKQKPPTHPPDLALTAVGRIHHPIATNNKSAQDYFDQGLTLVYGFNHEEAARSFEYAHKLDPNSPMPLWGVALAIGPNYNLDVDPEREKQAFETIQKAAKLAENSPQVERDYVSALAARFSGDANPDYKNLAHELRRGHEIPLSEISRRHSMPPRSTPTVSWPSIPGNSGRSTANPTTTPKKSSPSSKAFSSATPITSAQITFTFTRSKRRPNPSAPYPARAASTTLVPDAGHLVHMPSHIYVRTGFYADAVKSNEAAAKVDRVYAQKAAQQGSMYDLMYHSHNEHFLASAASMAAATPKRKPPLTPWPLACCLTPK